jgi:hypothetical protein
MKLSESIDKTAYDRKIKMDDELLDKFGDKYNVGFFEKWYARDTAVKRIRRGEGLPEKAAGGVVNEPSIAGEAGPEAVVPLPNGGKIPVKLDLSDMTSLLEKQTRQNDEILRYLRDSVDVQERIYSVQS